jgi:AcrR family transcriptional regulator
METGTEMPWGTGVYDAMLLGQVEPSHVQSLPRGVLGVDLRLKLTRRNRNPKAAPGRRRDAERTKAEILAAGIREFSERGLNGARVDNIAARAHTNKRMIYYYFKSKQRLYIAVLEEAYRRIREAEKQLKLNDLPPVEAIRCLAEFTFDYHWRNPELAKLVVIENVHKGKNLSRSESISSFNLSIIDAIGKVLQRGAEAGVLRRNIDPVELHMTVSALALFHVTNRYTFGTVFSRDMVSAEAAAQRKKEVVDIISRYVSA